VHIGDLVLDAVFNDRVPARAGNRSPDYAPQGVYRCAGRDGWVVLSIRDSRDWAALRSVVPGLDDPALESVAERRRRHDEIDAVIAAWTASRDKFDVFHTLQAAGIPAGPVMDEDDAGGDPQLHDRGFFHLLEHRRAGLHFHPGANVQLTGTPARIVRAAPVTGQDNEYVYRQILGVDDAEYARLVEAGHIGDTYL
jgi:crotonobetainyl-CoA:carnitine CoA-transferase CaiB-like acyl-CoA transferase